MKQHDHTILVGTSNLLREIAAQAVRDRQVNVASSCIMAAAMLDSAIQQILVSELEES